MTAIVFTGPSLPPAEAGAVEAIAFWPPVREGDMFRAARDGPEVVGIIDGIFEAEPSVWHKEILWAMSQGIHVVGASSMGALRAAELHPFGMTGIGRIFEAYRDGDLTDDDEVAVVHGPSDAGYRPVSDALVNMRASFAAAARHRVITAELADRLVSIGKAIFFKQRTYRAVFEAARREGLPGAVLDRLADWLETGRIDQKMQDAEALLSHVSAILGGQILPRPPAFKLNRTSLFLKARRRVR